MLSVHIISDGVAGAARGALEAAIDLNISHGGRCSKKLAAEEPEALEKYNLRVFNRPTKFTPSELYQNLRGVTFTAIFEDPAHQSSWAVGGGVDFMGVVADRPHVTLSLGDTDSHCFSELLGALLRYADLSGTTNVNVLGPTEAQLPEVQKRVKTIVGDALNMLRLHTTPPGVATDPKLAPKPIDRTVSVLDFEDLIWMKYHIRVIVRADVSRQLALRSEKWPEAEGLARHTIREFVELVIPQMLEHPEEITVAVVLGNGERPGNTWLVGNIMTSYR